MYFVTAWDKRSPKSLPTGYRLDGETGTPMEGRLKAPAEFVIGEKGAGADGTIGPASS